MHYPILFRILLQNHKSAKLVPTFFVLSHFFCFSTSWRIKPNKEKGKTQSFVGIFTKIWKKTFFRQKGRRWRNFFSPAALLVKCNLPPFSGDQGSTRGPQVGQKYRWDQFFFRKMVFLPKKSHGEVFFRQPASKNIFPVFFGHFKMKIFWKVDICFNCCSLIQISTEFFFLKTLI